jgi:hypothetical protein
VLKWLVEFVCASLADEAGVRPKLDSSKPSHGLTSFAECPFPSALEFIDSSVQLTGPTQTHADFIVEPLIRFDLFTSDSMQNNMAS